MHFISSRVTDPYAVILRLLLLLCDTEVVKALIPKQGERVAVADDMDAAVECEAPVAKAADEVKEKRMRLVVVVLRRTLQYILEAPCSNVAYRRFSTLSSKRKREKKKMRLGKTTCGNADESDLRLLPLLRSTNATGVALLIEVAYKPGAYLYLYQ